MKTATLAAVTLASLTATAAPASEYPFYPWDEKPKEITQVLSRCASFDYERLGTLMGEFDCHANNDPSHGETGAIRWRKVAFHYGEDLYELTLAIDERSLYIKPLPCLHRITVRKWEDSSIYAETYQYDFATGGWLHWIKSFPKNSQTNLTKMPKIIWPEALWKINDKFWLVPDMLVPKGDLSTVGEFAFTHFHTTLQHIQDTKPQKTLDLEEALYRIRARMALFEYKPDLTEHLQLENETEELKTGDCEDFTLYFLALARRYGIPLNHLGITMTRTRVGVKIFDVHVVPLVLDGGCWLHMDTLKPGSELVPVEPYIHELLSRWDIDDLDVYNFCGLSQNGEVVAFKGELRLRLPCTLGEWMEKRMERAKSQNFMPLITEEEIRAELERRLTAYSDNERKEVLRRLVEQLRRPEFN